MDKERQGKVHYVCFYSEPELEDRITVYPSVISKIDYIVGAVKAAGREVNVVSVAPSQRGYFCGYAKRIDRLENHTYLPSVVHENRFLSKLCFIYNQMVILAYLIRNVKKEDTVLVYHTLYHRLWLNIYRRISSRDLILQIEDVFSELSDAEKRFRKMEWKLLRSMKKCICVNDFVCGKLPDAAKKLVSYGSYLLPPKYDVPAHESIRLVYAGVIEQTRKAAFLAVEAMRHLTPSYELSILGFGREEDISAMQQLIADVNSQLGRTAVTFHGRLSGEQYWEFLQNCDIALSTHAYRSDSISSANHTFPSKVLTYMANGLPVVAQRLEVLELSAVRDVFSFYDDPAPEEIAKAILSVDRSSIADPRKMIEDLNRDFEEKMEALLQP